MLSISMAIIHRNALVQYSAEQMYSLVNTITDYPEFVPYCSGTEILSSTENEIIAKLLLDAGPIASSFTTRNNLIKNRQMKIELEDGPFSYLHGNWRFTQLGDDGCKVEFDLDFKFTSRIASIAFGKIFNKMTEKMFDAFLKRADTKYQ
jgi:ribosome-associated toxin RatA of RatAB toxin-antitoxin module